MRRLTAVLLLVWCGGGIVRAGSVDFELLPAAGYSPALSYQGGAAPLVGTGLYVDAVIGQGTPLNGGAALTAQATLSFSTGNLLATTSNSWEFAAGGSFSIVGTVPGLVNSPTTLFSGTFTGDTTIVDLGDGTFKVLGGAVTGTLIPALANEFGLQTPDTYPGGLSVLFQGSELPPGGFTDTTFNSGNFATFAAPEPASWVLLSVGATGLLLLRRTRFARQAGRLAATAN
jgi:hypothetical protein